MPWIVESRYITLSAFESAVSVRYISISLTPTKMGTSEKAFAVRKDIVHLKVDLDGHTDTIELQNVLHVHIFQYSPISISVLDKKRFHQFFENGCCKVMLGRTCVLV